MKSRTILISDVSWNTRAPEVLGGIPFVFFGGLALAGTLRTLTRLDTFLEVAIGMFMCSFAGAITFWGLWNCFGQRTVLIEPESALIEVRWLFMLLVLRKVRYRIGGSNPVSVQRDGRAKFSGQRYHYVAIETGEGLIRVGPWSFSRAEVAARARELSAALDPGV